MNRPLNDLFAAILSRRDIRDRLIAGDVDDVANEVEPDLSQSNRAAMAQVLENLKRFDLIIDEESAAVQLNNTRCFDVIESSGDFNVALVAMPWATVDYPSIGLSILKSAVAARGITCDVLYPSVDFAEAIGRDRYRLAGPEGAWTALSGEWVFQKKSLTEPRLREYLSKILRTEYKSRFHSIFHLGQIRDLVPGFLEGLASSAEWARYDVVGFSSTFQQNIPALRLAELLKQKYPDLVVVFGGANCEGVMGQSLADNYPFVDFVFQGEADHAFAQAVDDLRSGKLEPSASQPRLVKCEPVEDMDSIPIPDYSDFYRRVPEQHVEAGGVQIAVPFETSRGCWWGAKQHCTFCGLNGDSMSYRSKSSDRALSEYKQLLDLAPDADLYSIVVVDNILDYDYFNSLIPELAELDHAGKLFYEVKANLRIDQLRLLKKAGVYRIQPGIESFNDRILKLMRKGSTKLVGVQTLKWCTELSIEVAWNLLYNFPGERDEDYHETIEMIPKLEHLEPAVGVGAARADRFSPFFFEPENLGVDALTPGYAYEYVYANMSDADIERTAYSFEMESSQLASEQIIRATHEAILLWQKRAADSVLTGEWSGDQLNVHDTRAIAQQESYELSPLQSAALVLADKAISSGALARKLETLDFGDFDIDEVVRFLDSKALIITTGSSLLSLVVLDRTNIPDELDVHRSTKIRSDKLAVRSA